MGTSWVMRGARDVRFPGAGGSACSYPKRSSAARTSSADRGSWDAARCGGVRRRGCAVRRCHAAERGGASAKAGETVDSVCVGNDEKRSVRDLIESHCRASGIRRDRCGRVFEGERERERELKQTEACARARMRDTTEGGRTARPCTHLHEPLSLLVLL